MGLITAKVDGWPVLRRAVFERDRGCIATRWDVFGPDGVASDVCRDQWGNDIAHDRLDALEWDHVKEGLGVSFKAPDDEAHGVAVCPWHHRLSTRWRVDSWEHRGALRRYLRRLYPEVWDAA